MKDTHPSATAQRVAIRRAAHQLLDDPIVFDDPLALAIVGPDAAEQLRSPDRIRQAGLARALRAFIAARSRFAEDELAAAILRGGSQYVILGAGLDTFAYRNPYGAQVLRVFEVDHPATQAWKRSRLAASGIEIPPSVIYTSVDFERQVLAEVLARVGFQPTLITFFAWLGVTPYLTEEAFMATARFIASMPAGSGMVFDYAAPRSSLSWLGRLAFDALARRVAAVGEPFRLFFAPQALADRLRNLGLRTITDLGPDEINARYFKDRADGLRLSHGMAHLLSAQI
jgi:methyltransferase (TIGR00027 family)